jgi:hypothetical protein
LLTPIPSTPPGIFSFYSLTKFCFLINLFALC